jgi:hypothetical protein
MIKLARKWLEDLLNGGSFYYKNKNYFATKLEAIYFLVKMNKWDSIIKTFFYAKCKGRYMPNVIAEHLSNTFSCRFRECFYYDIVIDFLDLLTKTDIKQLYNRGDFSYLDNICDFVLSKIVNNENDKRPGASFSFKRRTLKSIIKLVNE